MLKTTVFSCVRSPMARGTFFLLTCLLLQESVFCNDDIYTEVANAGNNLKQLVFGTGGKTIMLVFGLVIGAILGLASKKAMVGIFFLCGVVLFILVGEKAFDLVSNGALKF